MNVLYDTATRDHQSNRRDGAWHDAAVTAERLVPYIGQVRSARPLTRLIATITGPPDVTQRPGMDDAVAAINHVLAQSSSVAPRGRRRRRNR